MMASTTRRLSTRAVALGSVSLVARHAAIRSSPLACSAVLSSRALSSSSSSSSAHGATASATFLPEGEVRDRVLAVVKNFPKVDPLKVAPNANFITDLGLDSLDTVELVMIIEEEFVITIPDDVAEKILTCEDAVKFISAHPMAR